jgi:tryptophan-rich sensory protein
MDYILKTAPTWATLAGFLAAAFGAASTGAIFQPGAWYRTIAKPGWTPPDWLFPIAWTILYIAMSVAAWWVSLSPSIWALPALAAWSWQIVMNALWSPVFFGMKRPGAAMIVMVFLWLAVAVTTLAFWHVERLAGWLMLPYLVWVSYAGALNLAIWRMNRSLPRPVAA